MTGPDHAALIAAIRICAPNFRALGEGLIAPGLLYRSGELAGFDDTAWAAMGQLGIRTLIDLRSPAETTQMPVRPPPSIRLVSVPFQPGDDTRFDRTADGLSASALISRAYRHMVTAHGDGIARVFRHLSEEDAMPAVLFCTAGKDRTGIVSALLLAALDADMAAIHADYALTNVMLTGDARRRVWDVSTKLVTFGMPRGPIVDAMLAADPTYLQAAFDAVSPIPTYFDRLGLDRALLDRLWLKLSPGE